MITLNIESSEKLLDSVGWHILAELQHDARIPFSELGRRVGLSAPAVTERVRRMEEAGIIQGYHAAVGLKQVGLPIVAYIRLNTTNYTCNQVISAAPKMPGVLECHRITGSDSYLIKVAVDSMENLEKVIDHIAAYGQPTTSIVLSSPVLRQTIDEGLLHLLEK
jgi:Lrp/AsnC family leucine-responsive transcriptional regulator